MLKQRPRSSPVNPLNCSRFLRTQSELILQWYERKLGLQVGCMLSNFSCVQSKHGGRNVYVSASLVKSIYGPDALVRLDEDEEMDDDDKEDSVLVYVKFVQLMELNELVIGALDQASFTFAQEGACSSSICKERLGKGLKSRCMQRRVPLKHCSPPLWVTHH